MDNGLMDDMHHATRAEVAGGGSGQVRTGQVRSGQVRYGILDWAHNLTQSIYTTCFVWRKVPDVARTLDMNHI